MATAKLNPSDITAPIRRCCATSGMERGCFPVRGYGIDAANHNLTAMDKVTVASKVGVQYDFIMSAGAGRSYFGRDQWPFVHTYLVGFRNRLSVLLQRADLFFTYRWASD